MHGFYYMCVNSTALISTFTQIGGAACEALMPNQIATD